MHTTPAVRAAALAAYSEIPTTVNTDCGDLAIHFFRAFVGHGGLVLDPKIWRPCATPGVARAIEQALSRRFDSVRASAELISSGAIHDLIHSHVDMSWDDLEHDPIQSVFRTEINRAHGEAFMAAGERTPGFAGWRLLLSPMHPRPDICDLLVAQNLYGLGPGVYPDRASLPWPAHPNTLTFMEIVFQDEITDADRAGKETELQALQRLAPEIRAGVKGLIQCRLSKEMP